MLKAYMRHLFRLIVAIISRVSIFVYPIRLSRFISFLLDSIASRRVAYLSLNSGQILLQRPFHILGHKYIKYGSLYSGPGLRIECLDNFMGQSYSPSLAFGENVCMNYRCHIGVINSIVVGNNVLIGSNVLITDHSHGYNDARDIHTSPIDRILYSKGPVIIEDNVWIGENVSILPGVTIGRNSIIGANSVVTKSIPAFCIASGNPANVIREIPHKD